jgi:hypothetical protein
MASFLRCVRAFSLDSDQQWNYFAQKIIERVLVSEYGATIKKLD